MPTTISLLTPSQESFHSILFNLSALYAATVILFGFLGLLGTNAKQRERDEKWREFYKSSKAGIKDQVESRPTNRILRSLDFLYYFLIRPSVIIAVLCSVVIIRNYNNILVSLIIAFGLSASVLSRMKEFNTKFIPSMVVFVGFTFGMAHVLGWQNGWH